MKDLVGHGEFDFVLWTMVNHLDISWGSEITRFVFSKYPSGYYMKDGFEGDVET